MAPRRARLLAIPFVPLAFGWRFTAEASPYFTGPWAIVLGWVAGWLLAERPPGLALAGAVIVALAGWLLVTDRPALALRLRRRPRRTGLTGVL